jgi:hypothetical protein
MIAAILVLAGAFSVFFMYRLLSGGRSVLEKLVYCAVLLVPFVGPLLYLFLSEEVAPQPSMLRNNGPRGAYTDGIIAVKASMEKLARQEAEAHTNKTVSQDGGDVRQ